MRGTDSVFKCNSIFSILGIESLLGHDNVLSSFIDISPRRPTVCSWLIYFIGMRFYRDVYATDSDVDDAYDKNVAPTLLVFL